MSIVVKNLRNASGQIFYLKILLKSMSSGVRTKGGIWGDRPPPLLATAPPPKKMLENAPNCPGEQKCIILPLPPLKSKILPEQESKIILALRAN